MSYPNLFFCDLSSRGDLTFGRTFWNAANLIKHVQTHDILMYMTTCRKGTHIHVPRLARYGNINGILSHRVVAVVEHLSGVRSALSAA